MTLFIPEMIQNSKMAHTIPVSWCTHLYNTLPMRVNMMGYHSLKHVTLHIPKEIFQVVLQLADSLFMSYSSFLTHELELQL